MTLPTTERSELLSELFAEFDRREQVGTKKYGVTVDREDLSEDEWEQHLLEELMDAVVYLYRKRRKKCPSVTRTTSSAPPT